MTPTYIPLPIYLHNDLHHPQYLHLPHTQISNPTPEPAAFDRQGRKSGRSDPACTIIRYAQAHLLNTIEDIRGGPMTRRRIYLKRLRWGSTVAAIQYN